MIRQHFEDDHDLLNEELCLRVLSDHDPDVVPRLLEVKKIQRNMIARAAPKEDGADGVLPWVRQIVQFSAHHTNAQKIKACAEQEASRSGISVDDLNCRKKAAGQAAAAAEAAIVSRTRPKMDELKSLPPSGVAGYVTVDDLEVVHALIHAVASGLASEDSENVNEWVSLQLRLGRHFVQQIAGAVNNKEIDVLVRGLLDYLPQHSRVI